MNFVWGYFWVIISSGAAWYFNFDHIVPFLFMGAVFQSIYLLSFYKNYKLHKPDVIASILTGTNRFDSIIHLSWRAYHSNF